MNVQTKPAQLTIPELPPIAVLHDGANQSQNVLAMIERVTSLPNLDTTTLMELFNLQMKIMAKNAEISFNAAISRLVFPAIVQKSAIKHNQNLISTYAKYEDIDAVIRPIYTAEGFSLSFDCDTVDGKVMVFGTLSHKDGHSRTAKMQLPLDTGGAKSNIQAMGSTITYAKRYLAGMLLNFVTCRNDNDGVDTSVISIEEAAEMDLMIVQVGANKKLFLDYMGVEDVRAIRTVDKAKAINALNSKAAENKKAADKKAKEASK